MLRKFRVNLLLTSTILIMNIIAETISSLSSDTLLSTIITLYTLLVLYLPCIFLKYIFSPVVLSTLILLLFLLRLGATQKEYSNSGQSFQQHIEDDKWAAEPEPEPDRNLQPLNYADSFVEWDVRAPLEVIYELEYEGDDDVYRESEMNIIQRYASLSLFYPESDSDASSEENFLTDGDWASPENMCFRWEEEDREGLIEIALEDKIDEDNLIEIDLSPAR